MLRMYVAQQCFNLSDEGMEDALYDSQAIRRFVGIDLARDTAPDATSRCAAAYQEPDRQARPGDAQSKKGNQGYFGIKAHIGVDADSGLVPAHRQFSTRPLFGIGTTVMSTLY